MAVPPTLREHLRRGRVWLNPVWKSVDELLSGVGDLEPAAFGPAELL